MAKRAASVSLRVAALRATAKRLSAEMERQQAKIRVSHAKERQPPG